MAWLRRLSAACLAGGPRLHACRAESRWTAPSSPASACPALQSIRKDTNPGEVMTGSRQQLPLLARNQKKATPLPDRGSRCRRHRSAGWRRPAARLTCAKRRKAEGAEPSAAPGQSRLRDRQVLCAGASAGSPPSARRVQEAPNAAAQTEQPLRCQLTSRSTACGRSPAPTSIAVSAAARAAGLRRRQLGRTFRPLRLQPDDPGRPRRRGCRAASPISTAMNGPSTAPATPAAMPEAYFRDSLRLLKAINASPVQELMAAQHRPGGRPRRTSAPASTRPSAPGAGERVRVACKDDGNRRLDRRNHHRPQGRHSGRNRRRRPDPRLQPHRPRLPRRAWWTRWACNRRMQGCNSRYEINVPDS